MFVSKEQLVAELLPLLQKVRREKEFKPLCNEPKKSFVQLVVNERKSFSS